MTHTPIPQNLSEKIALFRYGLISPILYEMTAHQNKHFQNVASQLLTVPSKSEPQRFSISTLKKWLSSYRKGGFAALYPRNRQDKGQTRVVPEHLRADVVELVQDYPELSAAGLFRRLLKSGSIKKGEMSESTFRRFMITEKLRDAILVPPKARKKYECAAVNQMWIADFMHGPKIPDPGSHNLKKKTYLCAILDDHSRLIVAAQFQYQENKLALADTFKSAVNQYGLPDRFYCDNGASFSSEYLIRVCAELQISLCHSKPYDSPSRGKIERFFKTVRAQFLADNVIADFKSMADFNAAFQRWLTGYHDALHTGIEQSPKARYFQSLNSTKIRREHAAFIDEAFLVTHNRLVHKDATIRLYSCLYEVPATYIGQKIDVFHPIDAPNRMHIKGSDGQEIPIRRVDKIGNSETPALGIQFRSIPAVITVVQS
jgi:transposase InsO family protein